MNKVKIENAKSGVPSCEKCGNPLIMYMCCECGSASEKKDECEFCSIMRILDKDYHLECE